MPISSIPSIGRPAKAGAKLIARRRYCPPHIGTAVSATDTAPALAAFAVFRGVGPGAGSSFYCGGGNGAYARVKVATAPGATFAVTIPAVVVGGTPSAHTKVTRNADTTVILQAAKGTVGVDDVFTNNSGAVADCIGDVKRAGGTSLAINSSGFTQRGSSAGTGGHPTYSSGYAGSAAGDYGDADSLGIQGYAETIGIKMVCLDQYGAGAILQDGSYHGITDVAGNNCGPGLVFVEYWDGDPDA